VVGKFPTLARGARPGLVEHEFDWVLVGGIAGVVHPDPTEVADWRLLGPDAFADAAVSSEFAPWFAPGLEIALRSRS
jgi:isopentenyldiphosphate isomerase